MSEARTALKHHHGGYSVPDLKASITWWQDVMGFDVVQDFTLPHAPIRIVMMQRGPLRVELFQAEGAHPLPPDRRDMHADLHTHGMKHMAFAVENIDAMVEEMTRRGADIVMTRKAPWGSFLFIRDNVGNLIEFCEQKDLF